jgi:hypothetical protein
LKNLKGVLALFEQISGMRINFHESELIPINLEQSGKLKREDLQPLLNKILRRIARWRGRLLSYSDKVVLIKTWLASIPVYLLSFIKFPKWALKLISTH